MNSPVHLKGGKRLVYLGIAFIVAPPAILFAIFGNGSITGNAATLTWLTPFFILAGIALLAVGISTARPDALDPITEKPHLNNPVMNAMVKRHNNWIWWFGLAAIWIPEMIFQWTSDASAVPKITDFAVWILPAAIVIGVILGKLIWKAPWHIILIGDVDLNPKDEREATILHRSAQYTLAVNALLLIVLYEVLLLAPRPSPLSLVNLIVTYWVIVRGTYGFIAWKMGLK